MLGWTFQTPNFPKQIPSFGFCAWLPGARGPLVIVLPLETSMNATLRLKSQSTHPLASPLHTWHSPVPIPGTGFPESRCCTFSSFTMGLLTALIREA